MSKKAAEAKYYTSDSIRKAKAVYNVIYGSRSFGKTFDMFKHAVDDYYQARKKGTIRQWAYLRRYDTDLKGVNISTAGDTLVCDGNGHNNIPDLTEGTFDTIAYYQKAWYLAKTVDGKIIKDQKPFMIAFAFPEYEHKKGSAFPYVSDIWFEEFIGVSGKPINKDEFVVFQNIISTIARGRHVTIWMTGNTINPFSEYWDWMGLTKAAVQKPGTIDIYRLGKTDKKIAVERTIERKEYAESKTSNAYLFAFDDPKLKMITTGEWEIGDYPLFDGEIKTEDICGKFYVEHKGKFYRGDVISNGDESYIYIHKDDDFTDPMDIDYDLIYSLNPNSKQNYRQRLDKALTDPERWIVTLMSMGKVFYDEAWTGVAIADYLAKSLKSA